MYLHLINISVLLVKCREPRFGISVSLYLQGATERFVELKGINLATDTKSLTIGPTLKSRKKYHLFRTNCLLRCEFELWNSVFRFRDFIVYPINESCLYWGLEEPVSVLKGLCEAPCMYKEVSSSHNIYLARQRTV